MSRVYLDRNSQNDSNSNYTKPTQQQVDFDAQMKWLDMNINNPGWNISDYSPAHMFAEEEEENVQLKSGEEDDLVMQLPQKHKPANIQMPEDVQSKMENSFRTDFSDVNIHKDSEQATNLGALAYTQGSDVHFAPGQYEPAIQKGQELPGHELTT